MERQKRAKSRAAGPAPLTPAAQARLDSQVAGVAGALEQQVDLAGLQEHLTPDPQDPHWDAHLMAALGALGHPGIPPLLAALFGQAQDKVRRKALKKALHRIKTRGVALPGDLLPREEAGFGAPRPGTAKVFVSPIFGHGESYVIFEGAPEFLGGNFLVARISDQDGLLECVLLSLKRRQEAEFWRRFQEQGLDRWFFPPSAYAVRLLEEAYTRHPDAAGSFQYRAVREKIFRYWGRPETAPDWDLEQPPLAPGDRPRLLEHCRQLALDPLFHAWLPGPEEIAPWLAKLQEVQNSPLVLSDQQKQARTDTVLAEAALALYPLETRTDWSRRLMTTAYYLHLEGRGKDSQAARAGAADLAAPDPSALAGENPFLKSLVQQALHLAWEMHQSPEPATPSGLVASPGETRLIRS
jgi:hypothetical protein